MSHWLLEVIAAALPGREIDVNTAMPESLGEQWLLAGTLAGVTPAELARLVADRHGLEPALLTGPNRRLATVLPMRLARRFGVLPIDIDERSITVATADPTDTEAVSQIGFATSRKVVRRIASPDDIDSLLTLLYAQAATREQASLRLLDLDDRDVEIAIGDNAPVARLCRALLKKAIERRASDVHVHGFAGGGVIRLRVDGKLQRVATLPIEVLESVLRFFKSQGGMDPTSSRAPQDGRAALTLQGRTYDLRISTLPAFEGESLVLRILDQSRVHRLENAHFTRAHHLALRRVTANANGLFLLTGPTGSGKTSTLYSLLSGLNTVSRRIITVEEPVEYRMPGITQVDVNAKAGLGFSATLRAMLRQDPDVLLIGEIRDEETADIAVNAALTGHLVLSTLHTMDALRAIPRLVELGVRPAVLGDTLLGVMSQRLVRQLCPHCRTPVVDPLRPLERLFEQVTGERPLHRPTGCAACHYTGYLGRLPVAEIVEVSDTLRSRLSRGETSPDQWMSSLPADWLDIHACAAGWIRAGETTPDEAQAVLGLAFWNHLSRRGGREVALQELLSQASSSEARTTLGAVVVTADAALGARMVGALDEISLPARCAPDGRAARDLLERHADVLALVLDTTGTADPVALLEDLRSHLAWTGLPVVLVTDPAQGDFLDLLERCGATDCVSAPVDLALLKRRVHAVLRRT